MARPAKLRELTTTPVSSELCQNAALILKHAHACASALLEAFNRARKDRGDRRGMTTDPEQDLLRAMLVMAAAGLDAMAKQLVRDTLPGLVAIDERARAELEKFVARQVRGDADAPEILTGGKFLARVLAASSQQAQVVEEYIQHLTGGSLQSPEGLSRTAAALGLDANTLCSDGKLLKTVFDIRNSIIHELDMDIEGDRRKRVPRSMYDMIKYANALLAVAESLRDAIGNKLSAPQVA